MDKSKPDDSTTRTVREIETILQTLLQPKEKGNIGSFSKCFFHDSFVIHIGTDISEYFTSWRDYLRWIDDFLNSRKGHEINVQNTNISLNEGQITAWYSQLIDTCYESKGEITRIEGFRHTGVVLKTYIGWKIVQSHVSAALVAES